jgi:hypothetical protein
VIAASRGRSRNQRQSENRRDGNVDLDFQAIEFDPFGIGILKRRELPDDWVNFVQCLYIVHAAAVLVTQGGDAGRLVSGSPVCFRSAAST